MKIALVKVQDTANSITLTGVQYPINICYLAQVCIGQGHDVEIWDFCVLPFNKEYIEERINKFKPEIIGLSCVTPAIYFGQQIAIIAKTINPEILTVIGSSHVSSVPIETMTEFPVFDIGVIMEAEEILPEIIDKFEKKQYPSDIPGTVYRENGKAVLAPTRRFPDVEAIPFPNRDLVEHDLYKKKHAARGYTRELWNIVEIFSSRGCPFSCTFCCAEKTHGKNVRYRSPDSVIREIEICIKKYNTNFVIFMDNTFTFNKKRVVEIVTALPKIGIEGYWLATHVNTVNYELLETLKKTGCKGIQFGVESGSNRVLKKIKKNTTTKKIIEAFDLSHRVGIPAVEGDFILGSDIYENEDDFSATEKLIKRIKPDFLALGIITPYPGTEQYYEMKKLGYLDNIKWDGYQIFGEAPPPWRIVNFTSEELVKRRNEILKSFYWNPGYILRKLAGLKSFRELIYYVKMALSFYRVVLNKA